MTRLIRVSSVNDTQARSATRSAGVSGAPSSVNASRSRAAFRSSRLVDDPSHRGIAARDAAHERVERALVLAHELGDAQQRIPDPCARLQVGARLGGEQQAVPRRGDHGQMHALTSVEVVEQQRSGDPGQVRQRVHGELVEGVLGEEVHAGRDELGATLIGAEAGAARVGHVTSLVAARTAPGDIDSESTARILELLRAATAAGALEEDR